MSQRLQSVPGLLPAHTAQPGYRDLSQATGRLKKNAAYFRVNYLVFVGLVTAVCFCFHPTSLIVLAFLAMAWVYLFLVRQAPIVLGGRVFRCGC